MVMKKLAFLFLLVAAGAATPVAAKEESRTTLSLNGTWQVEESVAADAIPSSYRHKVAVPGLTHSALPAFPDVDKYTTKQLLTAMVYQKRYKQADLDKLGDVRGISGQARNYFWYKRKFTAPKRHAVALLKVNKAQFGTLVYLNGVRIGEHWSNFTAGYFDVSKAIRWDGANELVIRIGAHPGVLPATVQGGTDFEKNMWTPGIYDDVSLIAADNPVIFAVQAAPRLAGPDRPKAAVLVQTELRNYSNAPVTTQVSQRVYTWKSGTSVATAQPLQVQLAPNETRLVTQEVSIDDAHLWSPEDPFLYRVETGTSGDVVQTRFGMREFHFDTLTQRAYLNGKPYFMRGSNIGLHRFFEDPQSGGLPWNEAWVQRLLVTIPKKMHWNAFRFTIGPVPDRWFEIADENGLLIQNEYAVWVGSPIYTQFKPSYDADQMISEYSEWMRDGWNHPSIVIWDATNESWLPEFASKIVPAVRPLDLSNRPWENSYNVPGDANDPVEDHHYFLEALSESFDASNGGKPFELTDLEWMDGPPANPFTKSAHAKILNEYGWMWLNRDGTPTLLTEKLYPKLLAGRANTTENRRALYARVLAGETELWRAYRRYAGVMHFVYLTGSDAKAFTSDAFIDLPGLKLEPHFEKAMEQANKPLGVYLNYWHDRDVAGKEQAYTVHMVNDEGQPKSGTLTLAFSDANGKQVAAKATPFALQPYGAMSYTIFLKAPPVGQYVVQAIAAATDDAANPTISTREVTLQATEAK